MAGGSDGVASGCFYRASYKSQVAFPAAPSYTQLRSSHIPISWNSQWPKPSPYPVCASARWRHRRRGPQTARRTGVSGTVITNLESPPPLQPSVPAVVH